MTSDPGDSPTPRHLVPHFFLMLALIGLATWSLQIGPTSFDWLLARAIVVVAVYMVASNLVTTALSRGR
jgi:hypothetical protein